MTYLRMITWKCKDCDESGKAEREPPTGIAEDMKLGKIKKQAHSHATENGHTVDITKRERIGYRI